MVICKWREMFQFLPGSFRQKDFSSRYLIFSRQWNCRCVVALRMWKSLLLRTAFTMYVSKSNTLRLTVSQSVSKSWCWAPFGAHDQIFITVWQLRPCFCGAPSLTRGGVCLLYMLLVLASAVFLGSESLGTRDHMLLLKIWDFPFRRLLRLAGSRWRYSTQPPHGFICFSLYLPRT
jgi:hypothetical protein